MSGDGPCKASPQPFIDHAYVLSTFHTKNYASIVNHHSKLGIISTELKFIALKYFITINSIIIA